MQELLADEVAFLAGELDELGDLLRDPLLLVERERDRRDEVGKLGLRRGDARDRHRLVGIEQVLHHDHRVVPLLDRLAVEVGGELGQRLRVVVDGDRHVLLRRGELVGDLLVQRGREPGHGPHSIAATRD